MNLHFLPLYKSKARKFHIWPLSSCACENVSQSLHSYDWALSCGINQGIGLISVYVQFNHLPSIEINELNIFTLPVQKSCGYWNKTRQKLSTLFDKQAVSDGQALKRQMKVPFFVTEACETRFEVTPVLQHSIVKLK